MGTIKTTNIEPIATNGTVTLGSSGDTFTVPSGVTVNMSSATQTGVGGDNTPAFKAYLSSTQSISNTTATKIVFQTEIFDTDSAYNTSDGLFTVPSGEGGRYAFNFSTRLTNWNTSQVQIYLLIDGSTDQLLCENGDAQGDNNSFAQSGVVNLSAGNTVAVYFYQDGGNGGVLRSGENNSFFSGYKIIE